MEKWDKKESSIESIIPLVAKYLEKEQNKPQTFRFSGNFTLEQIGKINEALK